MSPWIYVVLAFVFGVWVGRRHRPRLREINTDGPLFWRER